MSHDELSRTEALVAAVADLASGLDPLPTLAATYGDDEIGVVELGELAHVLETLPPRANWSGPRFLLPFYEAAAEALRAAGYEVWVAANPGRPVAVLVALAPEDSPRWQRT